MEKFPSTQRTLGRTNKFSGTDPVPASPEVPNEELAIAAYIPQQSIVGLHFLVFLDQDKFE